MLWYNITFKGVVNSKMAFIKHNHDECISSGISKLENHCKNFNLQLTPIRKYVYEILLKNHKAVGAYQILDILSKSDFSSKPPVAYRALDFLIKEGFVHKIESLNAFVACSHAGEKHSPTFLICKNCWEIVEARAASATKDVINTAKKVNFKIEKSILESTGLCPNCN